MLDLDFLREANAKIEEEQRRSFVMVDEFIPKKSLRNK